MLRNKWIVMMAMMVMAVLVACGGEDEAEDSDELAMLEVEFDVPETTEANENVELEAYVTFGGEPVVDPYEVDFEIWEMCDKDNSIHETPTNNEDGTYTLDHTFTEDGVYEVYAHTTAHDMHTMPKREITVGAGGEYDCDEEDDNHDMMDHEEEEEE